VAWYPHAVEPDLVPAGEPQRAPTPTERNWSVAAHLGTLVGVLMPFTNVAVPLVLWLVKRDESAFVGENARESLNFQISMTIWFTVAFLLTWILIGYLLLAALAVFDFVVVVLASLRASEGHVYRYPFTLRLVS